MTENKSLSVLKKKKKKFFQAVSIAAVRLRATAKKSMLCASEDRSITHKASVTYIANVTYIAGKQLQLIAITHMHYVWWFKNGMIFR